MDLLPFQAGADASEEETDYLDVNLDGELINGVKLEMPERDDDLILTTDDRPGQLHSTNRTYTACLAIQLGSTVGVCEPAKGEDIQPQAVIDTSEDTPVVEAAP